MTTMGTEVRYQRLRVPREHGAALIEPPRWSVESLLQENIALRERFADCDIGGQSLLALSEEARRLLLDDARRYTLSYRQEAIPVTASDGRLPTILLSGHQPQLAHPGVWFKSFVTDALARRNDAVGIQLLIDNDVLRTASIRVPSNSLDEPMMQPVPLDQPAPSLPYEERGVGDIQLLASFADRVHQTIAPLVREPLVGSIWPWAIEAAQRGMHLGLCLAQARHRLEGTWGLSTLELPLSHVCDTAPFRRFLLHMCDHLPAFHRLYNDVLDEYRRVHRIRSRSHPVADLATDGDWLEAPYWIWTADDPRRRPLFVQSCQGHLHLRAPRLAGLSTGGGQPDGPRIGFTLQREPQRGIEQLEQLRRQGIKLRPRALITTMYARLALGDLFIHGIGGAKYDQLTDLLIQRFLRLEPPAFLTVSATFRLPIDRPNVSREDLRHVDWLLRDMWYHPERHLDNGSTAGPTDSRVDQLLAERRYWISQPHPPQGRRMRHREIERLNENLRRYLEDQREQLTREHHRLTGLLRDEAILSSREYAFCLYPASELHGPLHTLANQGWVSPRPPL